MITLGEVFVLFYFFHLLLVCNSKLIVHGLVAQQVEHCTGVAETRVRIPLGLLPLYKWNYLKAPRITHFKLRFNPQFKYMTFMYQHHINGPHVLHN